MLVFIERKIGVFEKSDNIYFGKRKFGFEGFNLYRKGLDMNFFNRKLMPLGAHEKLLFIADLSLISRKVRDSKL